MSELNLAVGIQREVVSVIVFFFLLLALTLVKYAVYKTPLHIV